MSGRQGRPADVIANVVHKEPIAVIVMGMTCRTAVSGFFIGSAAETVLSQMNCSVPAVKPGGFTTRSR
jgi:nucleotide-binding universal stress UspA family protein